MSDHAAATAIAAVAIDTSGLYATPSSTMRGL
jgi:hypothetical protein